MLTLSGERAWVAGHRGMLGRALVRRLGSEDCEILTVDRAALDLRRQAEVESWLAEERPDLVFLAAAKVGGILANSSSPAEFIHDNLAIQTNVIHAAYRAGVGKFVFIGSSCIYPRHAPQPIAEDNLLSGPLEETNQWYAVAKIAGIKMCQAYRRQYGWDAISVMPTNLYGPHDNFDLQTAHVLPALIRKIHQAKEAGAPHVTIWGSGTPRRELLHVDDCADALVHLAKTYSAEEAINIGVGEDLTILELAQLIARIAGYRGAFLFDRSKPDGTSQKRLDTARLSETGWRAKMPLEDGIAETYRWFVQHAPQKQPAASGGSSADR